MKSRIALYCLVRDQSIQILGPLGKDLWVGIAFLKLKTLFLTKLCTRSARRFFWRFLIGKTRELLLVKLKRLEYRTTYVLSLGMSTLVLLSGVTY
jgi:hypothetical protein